MFQRRSSRVLALAGAGLLMGAVPASATEGPAATPLPNTLTPVSIPSTPPTVKQRPRVLKARPVPRRLHHGRRGQLRLSLAGSKSVRVVIEKRVGKKLRRARVITAAPLNATLTLKLRPLPVGRYRVTIVTTGEDGTRSRAVRRMLISTRR